MTAALSNTAQGTPFATGVDGYVYPQFIGYALRAPSVRDVYQPGTRWQDNSVSPPVIYETTGAGIWNVGSSANGSFTNLTVSGTSNLNTLTTAGAITAATGNISASNGNLFLGTAGNKIFITGGANASIGTTVALTAGSIVVANTSITANSIVLFTTNTLGTVTVPQAYYISARTPGVSFTITSQSATDTSTVNYFIIN